MYSDETRTSVIAFLHVARLPTTHGSASVSKLCSPRTACLPLLSLRRGLPRTGPDVSASDLIRLHWAYLLSLLEVGTRPTGNHPGLLILDEPQQQSVEEGAFLAMLKHAADSSNSQIIIATSHERESLGTYLKQIGGKHVVEYEDRRILEKIAAN
jgi:hypothetical protein